MAEDSSAKICDAISGWTYETLPPATMRLVKQLAFDSLGVIGGAARAAGIAAVNERLARWESSGAATSLIGHRKFSPPSAALANAAAAHALDFDDIHDPARVHSCCVILPAVLAAAEAIGGVSGKDFLTALALGIEMHARLGLAAEKSLAIGWHPTTLSGTPAASLAVGRLLGLDAARLRDAFGIGFHQTGGSIQSAYDGVLSKRLGPGFAARDAVTAAFLAADGLTGTREILDGKAGFFNLFLRGDATPVRMVERLGESWEIDAFSFKPYPGCRCHHATIGVALDLRREGLQPEQVKAVGVGLGETNWHMVGKPYDASLDSTVHAQFNAAYSFARALCDGRVGPRAYERPAITESRVVALAERIRVSVDARIEKNAMAPVHVRVELVDGSTIERYRDTIKGGHADPMSDADLVDKVRDCFDFGLGAPSSAADRLAEVVMSLERSTDAARDIVAAFPRVD